VCVSACVWAMSPDSNKWFDDDLIWMLAGVVNVKDDIYRTQAK